MSHLGTVQQVVILILGGGGAAAIYTLVKAFLAIRSSADSREATAIGNLDRWRIEADRRATRAIDDLDYQREMTSYWQRRAGTLEHLLVLNGVDPPQPPDKPRRHSVEAETRAKAEND